jgi:hypothetical protein
MENIKIGKREITIEGFLFLHTYTGLIIGSPNKVINNKIISDYKSSLNVGNRKSVFILNNMDYITDEVLKPVIYSTFFRSGLN